MMKKLLAWLFVMCLALTCAFAEDNDSQMVTPVLCNAIDRTVYEWYENNASRSLLAACVLLDFPNEERPDLWDTLSSGFAIDQVYVAKDEQQLNVYFFGIDKIALAIYAPSDQLMLVATLGDAIDEPTDFLRYMQQNGNLESYYAVDNDDIMEMIDMVIEILSE